MTTLHQLLAEQQMIHAETRAQEQPDYETKFQVVKELSIKFLPSNVSKYRRQFVTMAILGFQCQASNCDEPAQYYRRPGIPDDKHGIAPGSRTAKDVAWDRIKAAIPDHWGWCPWHYNKMTFEMPFYEAKVKQYDFFLNPNRGRFQYGTQEDVDALLETKKNIEQDQRHPFEPWEGSTAKDKRDHERFQNHIFSSALWFPYPADHPIRNLGARGYSR